MGRRRRPIFCVLLAEHPLGYLRTVGSLLRQFGRIHAKTPKARLVLVSHPMEKSWDLRRRTITFAVAVFRLCRTLPQTDEGRDVYRQIRRSSSSVAANYRAAKRASSDAVFLAKTAIVIEEADETGFWLEFMIEIELVTRERAATLLAESDELLAIFIASRKTVQERVGREGAKKGNPASGA